jgi:hypothetical protein
MRRSWCGHRPLDRHTLERPTAAPRRSRRLPGDIGATAWRSDHRRAGGLGGSCAGRKGRRRAIYWSVARHFTSGRGAPGAGRDALGGPLPHAASTGRAWRATRRGARLLFNAIVHQYLIPGVQVGAKVRVDKQSGEVVDAYSVVRRVTSEAGCLLCNRLINGTKLQDESVSEKERRQQRYVDDP